MDGWAHKANRWWYKVIIFMCLECWCVMCTFLWRVVCACVIGASLASVCRHYMQYNVSAFKVQGLGLCSQMVMEKVKSEV